MRGHTSRPARLRCECIKNGTPIHMHAARHDRSVALGVLVPCSPRACAQDYRVPSCTPESAVRSEPGSQAHNCGGAGNSHRRARHYPVMSRMHRDYRLLRYGSTAGVRGGPHCCIWHAHCCIALRRTHSGCSRRPAMSLTTLPFRCRLPLLESKTPQQKSQQTARKRKQHTGRKGAIA